MRNPKDPVNMKLPDGTAQLATWEYILDMVTPYLDTISDTLLDENVSLQAINERIQEWLDQQNGGEEET